MFIDRSTLNQTLDKLEQFVYKKIERWWKSELSQVQDPHQNYLENYMQVYIHA